MVSAVPLEPEGRQGAVGTGVGIGGGATVNIILNTHGLSVKKEGNNIIIDSKDSNGKDGAGKCTTIETGNSCKFPFTFKGHTFHQCTLFESDKLWCATGPFLTKDI